MKQINSIKTKEEFDYEVSLNKNTMRAIRLKCYDCSSYQSNEAKDCPVTNCPLYPFRNGKNPFRKRELTEDEKREIRNRLTKSEMN